MQNKTVIITGGDRGIGADIAVKFAENGANIVVNYKFDEPKEMIEKLQALGVKATAVYADVSNFDECEALIKKVKQEFGTIDVLVNNAGITKDNLMLRMSEKDFDDVINVNLKGTFNMTKHASAVMLKQKSGAIINISSVVGITGNTGQVNYAASKAGVIGITKSSAKELASRGITVNAIAPGFIETQMTAVLSDEVKAKMLDSIPLKRLGSTNDIAETALFLAKSNYITGEVIKVDGGMCM